MLIGTWSQCGLIKVIFEWPPLSFGFVYACVQGSWSNHSFPPCNLEKWTYPILAYHCLHTPVLSHWMKIATKTAEKQSQWGHVTKE